MIRFDVSALTKAYLGASLILNVDTGPQDLTDLQASFFRGTLQVTRIQSGLLVQGTLQSQLGLECVRCLESFVLPIALELEETFRLPGASQRPDVLYGVNDAGWLDLAPLLREQSWLAIPMKSLCNSECRGLCPQCGANLNFETCTCESVRIDPRLALLKDLIVTEEMD
jgi:uncharacterized protein